MTLNDRIARLGLGTVQFGLDYGISNTTGQPARDEVSGILETAARAGIRLLDTAALYGDSEAILGKTIPENHAFQIVTKTPCFSRNNPGPADALKLQNAFRQSLARLRAYSIHGLLIHHADDLLIPGGALLHEAMAELKAAGHVEKIGVSIYNARQIDHIMDRYVMDVIQVPVSLLDQRLLRSGHLKSLKQAGVEIHARSVFLQGLLLMPPDTLSGCFESVKAHLGRFHADCAQQGISPITCCLDFVMGLPEIDRVVVGVCSVAELRGVLEGVAPPGPGTAMDYTRYGWHDERILDPVQWVSWIP